MAASTRLTPAERSERARLAALTRWAHTRDRTAATAPARRGLLDRYAREADPLGDLSPTERHAAAERLLAAQLARARLKASKARRAS